MRRRPALFFFSRVCEMPRVRAKTTFRRCMCGECFRALRRIKYKYPHARRCDEDECVHCAETAVILELHAIAKRMRAVRHRWLVSDSPRNSARTVVKPFREPPVPMSPRQLFAARDSRKFVDLMARLAASEKEGFERMLRRGRRRKRRWTCEPDHPSHCPRNFPVNPP